jgi:hypothetical protein
MSMDLDMQQFRLALKQYVTVCKDSLADIINRKLLFVARGAWKRTPIVDRATLENLLGVVGYKVSRSRKTGQLKRGKAIVGGPLVAMIINAARGRRGEPGLYGKTMQQAAQKLVGSRLRAIGSMRSGWIKGIRTLAATVKESSSLPATRIKNPGAARPARQGWNPVAEITYNVTVRRNGQDIIDPRVETALREAFVAETASMQDYIARKMQEKTNQFNAA